MTTDKTKKLIRGQAKIRTRDTSEETLTVTADAGSISRISRSFQRVSAACPTQALKDSEPSLGTPTFDARRFLKPRVNSSLFESDVSGFIEPAGSVSSISSVTDLALSIQNNLNFDANKSSDTDNTSYTTLPDEGGNPLSIHKATQINVPNQSLLKLEALPQLKDAFRFDGGDFYTFTNSEKVQLIKSTQDFLIEFAVQVDDNSSTHTVFAQYVTTPGVGTMRIYLDSAGVHVELGTAALSITNLSSTPALEPFVLYHIMVVLESGTISLFKNGVLEDSSGSVPPLGLVGAVIGARTSGTIFDVGMTDYLSGYLAYFRIYYHQVPDETSAFVIHDLEYEQESKVSITDPLILNVSSPAFSPWLDTVNNVSYLGDLRGNTLASQVDTNLSRRPTFTEDYINGKPVLHFDGTSDHIEFDNVCGPIDTASGNFTVTTLVHMDVTQSTTYFMSFNEILGGRRILVGYEGDPLSGSFNIYDGGTSSSYDSTSVYPTGFWYLCTVTHEGASSPIRLYVNGILILESASTSTIIQASDRYCLGAELDGATPSNVLDGKFAFQAIASSSDASYRTLFESLAVGTYLMPKDLPEAVGAYSADSLTELDGVGVASWEDLTVNANDALQSTSPARPVYREDVLHGKPGLTFNGKQHLKLDVQVNNASAGFSAITLMKNTSGEDGTLISLGGGSEGFRWGLDVQGDAVYEEFGATPTLNQKVVSEDPRILSLDVQSSPSGTSLGRNDFYTTPTTLSSYNPVTGAEDTLIGTDDTSLGFSGVLFELGLFNTPLNLHYISGLHHALNLKYGLYQIRRPEVPEALFEFDVTTITNTADTSTVSSLVDATGNSDATVAGGGALYRSNLISGLPSLYFSGNDYYTTSSVMPLGASERTVFVVCCPYYEANIADGVVFGYGGAEDFSLMSKDTPQEWQVSTLNQDVSFGAVPSYTLEIISLVYTGTDLLFYRNGLLISSETTTLDTLTGFLTIGDRGLGADASNRYQGWLSYLMISDEAMDQDSIVRYTDYLARKFALPL